MLTENIFALPGMGTVLINAIFGRDYPVVQGTILIYTLMFVAVNIVDGLLYTRVDPEFSSNPARTASEEATCMASILAPRTLDDGRRLGITAPEPSALARRPARFVGRPATSRRASSWRR